MFLLFLLGVFPGSIPWVFGGVDKSYVLDITKTLRLYNTSTSKGVHLTQPTRPSSFSTYACFRNLWVKKTPNGNRNAKTTFSDFNFPKKKITWTNVPEKGPFFKREFTSSNQPFFSRAMWNFAEVFPRKPLNFQLGRCMTNSSTNIRSFQPLYRNPQKKSVWFCMIN